MDALAKDLENSKVASDSNENTSQHCVWKGKNKGVGGSDSKVGGSFIISHIQSWISHDLMAKRTLWDG